MFATRVLRQAAQHAERTPMIKFIGKRTIPASIDHSPHPHPASPTHSLPADFTASHQSAASRPSHSTFSSYRDHAQQFGPLRKTIRSDDADPGIGGLPGAALGPVNAPAGMYFDRNELPERFRRAPLSAAEIEALESGGASLYA
ncbi:hypothetical protein NKR23_g11342 [Pleurostoma richardsiae]|uniref:Uncharacterized protein n=1 Tax=Pleurostoma richardsiae TaxID=41990 RepID=A0AA38RJP9_9PEZI|nr:hypothetical protein NKR23_g11342 [Pleurostoma richardsiae]